MLKKIPVDDLRLGMHLHAMCGAWLDHPFWRTKFILNDPADLEKLRASSVKEVWIDAAKGRDVEPPATAGVAPRRDVATAAARAARPEPAPAETPPPREPTPSAELGAELQRASALVNQSREAVSSLFAEARMGRALDTEKCLPLVDEIATSVWRNPGAIVSLARLKTHDDYTYLHSMAVCALMVSLGRQLGMDEDSAREVGLAGMLHDMGKAAMPLEVLNKPGKLTDAEYAIMKTHPQHGYDMLLEGKGVGEIALDVTLHHHERPDGRGYPHGLTGEALTRVARMGAVCDVYDAITSNRPYKSGWDPAESIAKMASWAGQFDTEIFQAFVKSLASTRSARWCACARASSAWWSSRTRARWWRPRSSCSSPRAPTCRCRSSWSTSPRRIAPMPSSAARATRSGSSRTSTSCGPGPRCCASSSRAELRAPGRRRDRRGSGSRAVRRHGSSAPAAAACAAWRASRRCAAAGRRRVRARCA